MRRTITFSIPPVKLSAERRGKPHSHLVDRRLAWLRRLYPQTSPDPAQFLFFLTAKPRRKRNRELPNPVEMRFCYVKKQTGQGKKKNRGWVKVWSKLSTMVKSERGIVMKNYKGACQTKISFKSRSVQTIDSLDSLSLSLCVLSNPKPSSVASLRFANQVKTLLHGC